MFDAAAELGIRFWGAPYLLSTGDAKANLDGIVHHAGDDGQTDLGTWDALQAKRDGAADGRILLAMSPHATGTCSPDLLPVIQIVLVARVYWSIRAACRR